MRSLILLLFFLLAASSAGAQTVAQGALGARPWPVQTWFAGSPVDPRAIRVLTSGDIVTVVQPTGSNLHIVVDGSVAVTGTFFQTTQPVSATNLDIRDLAFATDKVDASGSTMTAVQPTGTNFHIVCDSGCGSAAAFSDNSAFTAGTTGITIFGGVFNDALAAVTSGNAATPRITDRRGLHINMRTAAGVEVPFPAALGANGGFKIEGVASGTPVPVSDAGGSLTVDGTVTTSYPGFVTATAGPWTSATALNTTVTLTLTGSNTVRIALVSPTVGYFTGKVSFLASHDGTNYQYIGATADFPVDSYYTQAQQSRAGGYYLIPLSGITAPVAYYKLDTANFSHVQVVLSEVITGSGGQQVTVVLTGSQVPTNTNVVASQGVNGTNLQGWWTWLGDGTNGPATVTPPSTAATAANPALVTRSVQFPTVLAANGGLKVEGVASGTPVPVSGTVTANQGINTSPSNAWWVKMTDASGTNSGSFITRAAFRTDPALVVIQSPNYDMTAMTNTSATVGTSSAQCITQNTSRMGLILTNTSTATISICIGTSCTASIGTGVTLVPGATWTMNQFTFVVNRFNCIASAAGSNLSIQEF